MQYVNYGQTAFFITNKAIWRSFMEPYAYYEYYDFDGASFFTLVLMPDKSGKFPTVITRSPYVGGFRDIDEEEILKRFKEDNILWAKNNYVLVFQHCRGQGKSTGEFVPYIHEREDGLALRRMIRKKSFYNGQLFLMGGSYTASLHYSTAPFEEDIKGAVFDVQDSERYRLWYRRGQMRRGHANWHFNLYKAKSGLKKCHTIESFSQMPIKNLSKRVLGELAEDFEEMLSAERFDHPFWKTRYGGNEARDAVSDAGIPVLLTTGYNDFYVGGMFKMWNEIKEATKEKSALIVSPYNHGQTYDEKNGICFNKASVAEKFGKDYRMKWFNAILNKEEPFVKTGKVTYYRTFEDKWDEDFYMDETEEVIVPVGNAVKTIIYNPQNPPGFSPEGTFMDASDKRNDIITVYTEPFDKDIFVKGKMRARLCVESDCDDTSFYIMIGICTENGDYSLRHDITSILYQKENYNKNNRIELDFEFDEYAFLVQKGQMLRIDIAPTDKNTYVCHTNIKGDYSLIEESKTARNMVYLKESFLVLPVEKE